MTETRKQTISFFNLENKTKNRRVSCANDASLSKYIICNLSISSYDIFLKYSLSLRRILWFWFLGIKYFSCLLWWIVCDGIFTLFQDFYFRSYCCMECCQHMKQIKCAYIKEISKWLILYMFYEYIRFYYYET